MRAVVYFGSRALYDDFETAVTSLLAHTRVDKVYAVIEDDALPYDLPVECVKWTGEGFNNLNTNGPWTRFGCLRAALPYLFPDLDRILSLDVDTIVEQDIGELFELDLSGYYFAAARELRLSAARGRPYYNAGVCMMNLQLLRDSGKAAEMIRLLNSEYLVYVSQDAMHKCCDRVLELHSMYNACCFTAPTANVKIRHYAARSDWRKLPEVERWRHRE